MPFGSTHEAGFVPHVPLFDIDTSHDEFRRAALEGLRARPKHIPPKYLYDERGAHLFERICQTEEYYLTRTETRILQETASEIADVVGTGALIELGSGSSRKVRILLDAMERLPVYVALDVSKEHMERACRTLAASYPGLSTVAVCMDFLRLDRFPSLPGLRGKARTAFFPGSSIGNLEPAEAAGFLRSLTRFLGPGGNLIIGVDLKKPTDVIESAYNDVDGFSEAFAFNILERMRRELGADFDLARFRYEAPYNPVGRVEMRLVSLRDQLVRVAGEIFEFGEGETLLTEHSYKYSIREFMTLALGSGFTPCKVWTDPDRLFSIHWLMVECDAP